MNRLPTRAAALRLVKMAASAADRIRSPGRGIVVLLYHRVGGLSGQEFDLTGEIFDRQMQYLSENTVVITLAEALRRLESPVLPDHDPVVITFDDGTADFVDVALPILQRHGLPATLYIATDHVERRIGFPHGGTPLTWEAVRETLATGLVTVGSHTHTHALLDRIPRSRLVDELDRSVELIGSRLGVDGRDLAYPKAVTGSSAVERAVRARFRSAAVGGCRPNPYGTSDLHRLARSPIQATDGMKWFIQKVRGGMALEDGARGRINRYRYRDMVQ